MFIYIASPYYHNNPAVREQRYLAVQKYAVHLMKQRDAVYSPIAHNHPLHHHFPESLQHDFDFWMAMDLPILKRARVLHVYQLDGWAESRGVAREVAVAEEFNIPTLFIKPFLEQSCG